MANRVRRISIDEARRLLQRSDILLVDVRQPEEYKKGHIPGAVLIPLPEIPDRLKELNTEKEIITYCRLGRRSFAAAQLIADELNIEVYTIDGGIMAWNGLVAKGDVEEGLQLTRYLRMPEEFISLAYTLEDGSERFYKKLADLFLDKKAKELFNTLSLAEENHKKRISEKWKGLLIDERFKDYMESGLIIGEAIEKIAEKIDLREALEYSMQIEINSLDLYMKILRIVDENTRAYFREIIEEEKSHLKKLGAIFSE